MVDVYLEKFADLLVNHSLAEVDFKAAWEEGQKRLSITYNPEADPLARLVAERVYDLGGNVFLDMKPTWDDRVFYGRASDAVLDSEPEFLLKKWDYVAGRLFILSQDNTKHGAKIDTNKRMLRMKNMTELREKAMGVDVEASLERKEPVFNTPWVLTAYPTEAYAQDFGLPIESYSEYLWDLLLLNEEDPVQAWKDMKIYQRGLIDNVLSKAEKLTIVADDGTNLEMKLKDETREHMWIPAYGTVNMPCGEVFNAPIKDSVNGVVKFPILPQCFLGGPDVENVEIHFENGKVVDFSADKGEHILEGFFDESSVENTRYLGEIAIGLNSKVKKISKQILFDEKMGGSVHMAFGMAYPFHVLDPEADKSGLNEANPHWDMIKRMWASEGGYVLLDDKTKLTWDEETALWETE